MYELKENTATIFKNEKKGENHPDYKGQVNVEGKLFDIALWEKEGKKGKYFNGKVSEPYKKSNPAPEASKHYAPAEPPESNFNEPEPEGDLPF